MRTEHRILVEVALASSPRPSTRTGVSSMSASRGPSDLLANLPASRGRWLPDSHAPTTNRETIRTALTDPSRLIVLVRTDAGPALAEGGSISLTAGAGYPVLAVLPSVHPSSLGDPSFTADHRIRFPYVTG